MDDLIELNLFHGTSYANAKSILANGIDLNKRRHTGTNFYGNGFYLTNELILAENYADEFGENFAAILKVKVIIEPKFIKSYEYFELKPAFHNQYCVQKAVENNYSLLDLSFDDGIYVICSDKNIDVAFELSKT